MKWKDKGLTIYNRKGNNLKDHQKKKYNNQIFNNRLNNKKIKQISSKLSLSQKNMIWKGNKFLLTTQNNLKSNLERKRKSLFNQGKKVTFHQEVTQSDQFPNLKEV